MIAAIVWAVLGIMCLAFHSEGSCESGIRPRDFESITVYGISGISGIDFLERDKTELAQVPFVLIEKQEHLNLFHNAYYYSGSTRWRWKAPLGCVVKLKDGSSCRIRLSYGMAFFQILGQEGHYRIAEDNLEEFRNMVEWIIGSLNAQTFNSLGASSTAIGFRQDEFEIAAKAYASGDLKGAKGVVQLPNDLAGVTIDGRMYVTQAPVSDNLYLFITWRGKGSNLRGYIFRLANAHDSPDMNVDRIDVLGPTIWEPGFGKIEVEIESTLVPGWYKAKRDMD